VACQHIGFPARALSQDPAAFMVGELPPQSDFIRGAEAADTQARLAFEFAGVETRRCNSHDLVFRGFRLEVGRRRGDCFLGRRQKAGRVKDEHKLRDDMDASSEQRIEESEGSKHDAEGVDADGAGEVLPDDAPCPSGDGERFDEALEIVAEQHHIGALLRHVGAGPHGHADIGFGERRCVIDTIANHGDDAFLNNEGLNARQLVLGQQFRLTNGVLPNGIVLPSPANTMQVVLSDITACKGVGSTDPTYLANYVDPTTIPTAADRPEWLSGVTSQVGPPSRGHHARYRAGGRDI
jgi:hypothetical protein